MRQISTAFKIFGCTFSHSVKMNDSACQNSFTTKFVLSENGEKLPQMMKVFQAMSKDDDSNVEWITHDDCLKVSNKDKYVLFILSYFDSRACKHIVKTNNRVYGPMCIQTCIQLDMSFPKLGHPVHNMAMFDLTICGTGIKKERRDMIYRHVQYMGGNVSRDLHPGVTHLIASSVGSQKYQVAASLGKSIMIPEWVDHVWNVNQNEYQKADGVMFSQFRCKIFHEMSICASGIDLKERSRIRDLITSEGGKYSGDLALNKCTHLVMNKPTGEKYKFARKWNMQVVKVDWVYKSIAAGYCLSEAGFLLESTDLPHKASTPDLRDRLSDLPKNFHDISAIPDPNLSKISESRLDITQQNETKVFIEDFDVSVMNTDQPILDGCQIYLSGFKESQLEKLRRLINRSGGIRLSDLRVGVTHVVIGALSDERKEIANAEEMNARMVTVQWLLDCAQQNVRLPEEPYLVVPNDDNSRRSENKGHEKVFSSNTGPAQRRDSEKRNPTNDDTQMDEDDSVLMQAVADCPALETAASAKNRETKVQSKKDSNQRLEDVSRKGWKVDSKNVSAVEHSNQDQTISELSQLDDSLFRGSTFSIAGFETEVEIELTEMIRSGGGLLVSAYHQSPPGYSVVPVQGGMSEANTRAAHVVTDIWIHSCVERNSLLDVSSNFLYVPIKFVLSGCQLKGAVISVSGYSGRERHAIEEVIENFGGDVQDQFVKKASATKKKNTHLISNTTKSSKYLASLKWKIPAVTADWLCECGITGQLAPVRHFLLEKPEAVADENAHDVSMTAKVSSSCSNVAGKEPLGNSFVTVADVHMPDNAAAEKEDQQRPQGTDNHPVLTDCPTPMAARAFDFDSPFTPGPILPVKHRRISTPLEKVLLRSLQIGAKNSAKEFLHPLKGKVISVSRKLQKEHQNELHRIAVKLGAEFRKSFSADATHYICVGKASCRDKEFKKAEELKQFIVAPQWLQDCDRMNDKANEVLYPCTLNQKGCWLEFLSPCEKSSAPIVKQPESVDDNDGGGGDDDDDDDDEDMPSASLAIINDIRSLMQITSNPTPQGKRGRKHDGDETRPKVSRPVVTRRTTRSNSRCVETDNPEGSQAIISWDDPQSRLAQAILGPELEKTEEELLRDKIAAGIVGQKTDLPNTGSGSVLRLCSDSEREAEKNADIEVVREAEVKLQMEARFNAEKTARLEGNTAAETKQDAVIHAERDVWQDETDELVEGTEELVNCLEETCAKRGQLDSSCSKKCEETSDFENLHFQVSSVDADAKMALKERILQLNGNWSEAVTYDVACTHLIVGKPVRNEKFLSFMASGKFIMHPSYVEESVSYGNFLKEDKFEWGCPTFAAGLTKAAVDLVSAAKRWRLKLQHSTSRGAFDGWCAVLLTDPSREKGLKTLLTAGAAKVVSSDRAYGNIAAVTHVFYDPNKTKHKVRIEPFLGAGVPCIKPDYIASFLVNDPVPDIAGYVISETRTFSSKRLASQESGSSKKLRS